MNSYRMAYASLPLAIGAIYIWSYVYNIVRGSSIRSSMQVELSDSPMSKSSRENSLSPFRRSLTESLLSSGDEDHENGLALPQDIFEDKPQASVSDKIKQRLETFYGKMNLKRLFAPSTIGVVRDGATQALTLIMGRNLLKGIIMLMEILSNLATRMN
ncbi:hypothetical protein BUALT_Bualt08G0003100 [Buddleja alternifolia]|uniref:Uncharacterized protein n=1 Tax=Buddleja alternifolia TaxID=168488 RepID=A0AAV6XA03_9LAMI|nr:hypothetical protein BUALT_Bualt08G0003100 [Buddleja alternifolia]